MPGPLPKPKGERRRRNKVAGSTTLVRNFVEEAPKKRGAKPKTPPVPEHVPQRWRNLPRLRPTPYVERVAVPKVGVVEVMNEPDWHSETLSWWADVVRSELSTEYLDVDWQGVYRLALMVDNFWWSGGDRKFVTVIGMEGAKYGQSPLDRKRLAWEIDRTAAAEDRNRTRRQSARAAAVHDDPRARLRAVP